MLSTVLLAVYCTLIVLASLGGGWLPALVRFTHQRLQLMMSGVAGLMLGVAVFHMLPHSFTETGSIDRTVWWMMVGLLLMFFLIRAFDFHQHDVPDDSVHTLHCEHEHGHGDTAKDINWVGVAFGLSLHTLIDGMALAASVQLEALHGSKFPLFGFGIFLAILLHKPLDAMSITALMRSGGWSMGTRQLVNASFSLMCPVGALLFSLSVQGFSQHAHEIVGCGLGFSAGVFLCISLGDLLPELQFHAHDRLKLSTALLAGVAIAYGIGFLEPTHTHQRAKDSSGPIPATSVQQPN